MTYLEEFASVLVAVIDADGAAEDANVKANAEVRWKHRKAGAVLLQDHLALEEHSLRSATVGLARLADHDRVVFEVVENDELANAVVFKAALNHALLEVAGKSENLYNK